MVTTLAFAIEDVDWATVVASARDRTGTRDVPPHVLADALSLSALFAKDFRDGITRIDLARDLEPLNPIHQVRYILFLLRFGASERALEHARTLQEQLPSLAVPGFLRALATHQQGESKRAANAAAEVVASHPGFALARFLQADAQSHIQFKGLNKLLTGLPKGEAHAANWLDFAAKLLLSGSEEGQALAAEILANPAQIPQGSRERALADELRSLQQSDIEDLEARLSAVPAGSRAEEILLTIYHDRLEDSPSAIETLRRLLARFPERPAVRRVYVARLTRQVVELAGLEKYPEALRLLERCLQLEPHELIHHQNRAALFTLLREPSAYHDAWADYDRHQYRLALLGRITPDDAEALARPHRLFAQQARLQADGIGSAVSRLSLGFLKEEVRSNEGARETLLVVNNERIDDDPDLLRQWVHHRRAELTFTHWSLGLDPRRFLLEPEDLSTARTRLTSLAAFARSLEVLVPDEGRLLADRLVAAWTRRAREGDPGYSPFSNDPEILGLKLLHLETLGDLALLCLTWKPSGGRPRLVEEILSLLIDEAAFYDDMLHREVLLGKHGEASYPLKFLVGFINESLGLDPNRATPLNQKQRASLTGRLAGELLTRLAYRTYEEYGGAELGARHALTHVDRARTYDPENVRTELVAARFLLIAGHDDESRATLDKLQKSARARDPEVHAEVEELRQILDQRARSGNSNRPRTPRAAEISTTSPARTNQADLEAEIDQFSSSIPAYEELARKLLGDGRFAEALDWSERALTQCLSRDGQFRARSLNLEVLGLTKLAERDSSVVKLYLAGAHGPALEVLEANPDDHRWDYTLDFLMGHCRLALGRPDDAQRAFERAIERCSRQLHRPVLRALAMDVDQPFLLVARRSIADKISEEAFEAAVREVWTMMSRLRRPEPALVDLAQVHLDAALARMGTSSEPLPAPTGSDRELCGGRLAEIYAVGSDLKRARRFARLSLETHEPSRRKAELILRKADALEQQSAMADVLARSGSLLRQGDFEQALAVLDDAGSTASAEPRFVRQKALLLLKLERFEAAESAAAGLRSSNSPVAREFLESFPGLAFRQRVASASRMLREGASAEALALLDGAVAGSRDEAVELAFCRGFARTIDAYRARRAGDKAAARAAFEAAMDAIEPRVADARAAGHSRLIELYETLDKEIDR